LAQSRVFILRCYGAAPVQHVAVAACSAWQGNVKVGVSRLMGLPKIDRIPWMQRGKQRQVMEPEPRRGGLNAHKGMSA